MHLFLEALNNPAKAFKRSNSKISLAFVITTVMIVAVFDPIINYFVNGLTTTIDILKMFRLSAFGCITYLTISCILWLVCKVFGSKTPVSQYFMSWGISYIPTIICAVIVSLSETFFYLFWNNPALGIFLNITFVAILIWKCTLYIIFLREVAELKGKKMAGAFIVCSLFILALALLNAAIGLKTPIL